MAAVNGYQSQRSSATMAVGFDNTVNALRMKFNANTLQGLGEIARFALPFEVKSDLSVFPTVCELTGATIIYIFMKKKAEYKIKKGVLYEVKSFGSYARSSFQDKMNY